MDTSNHSWNAGDRPSLRVTAAGMELLAYLDYVTPRTFVSLAPSDTSIPPEQYDDERQPPEVRDVTPHLDDFDLTDDDDDDYGDHSPEED